MSHFSPDAIIESLKSQRPSPMWPHAVHLLEQIQRWFPGSLPVAVVGSASYEYDELGKMRGACDSLGRLLSQNPDVCLLTGGMPAIGQDVGSAFAGDQPFRAPLVHLLPIYHGDVPLPDAGRVLKMVNTFEQRQELLALSAGIVIVIGGGPGAAREANLALSNGAIVLPIAGSGGAAAGMKFGIDDPLQNHLHLEDAESRALEARVETADWEMLISPDTMIETSTGAACAIVRQLIAS